MKIITRRKFAYQSALAIAGSAALPFSGANSIPKKLRKWGIITNTVRNEMADDYRGTLSKLADLGYRYIEGGHHGDSVQAYGKLLKKLGLKSIAAGSSISNLQKSLESFIRNGHALQQKYIVVYWPWTTSAQNLTVEECLQAADRLNRLGRQLKREGLRLAWHNHDKEFVTIGDKTAFDYLMKNTDPAYSTVQLDLYWVYKGNHDPLTLFEKYPGRFELVHVKDMDQTDQRGKACIGQGIVDFKAIFDRAKLAGIKYAIVENEGVEKGLECAEVSMNYLRRLAP